MINTEVFKILSVSGCFVPEWKPDSFGHIYWWILDMIYHFSYRDKVLNRQSMHGKQVVDFLNSATHFWNQPCGSEWRIWPQVYRNFKGRILSMLHVNELLIFVFKQLKKPSSFSQGTHYTLYINTHGIKHKWYLVVEGSLFPIWITLSHFTCMKLLINIMHAIWIA